MIRHRCARGFHDAVGVNFVVRGNGLLQWRIDVVIRAINFERLQIHWQFAKRKWRHTTGCEIEPRATLCLRPMHVIGMLVSHESSSVTRILTRTCKPRSTAVPAVRPIAIRLNLETRKPRKTSWQKGSWIPD